MKDWRRSNWKPGGKKTTRSRTSAARQSGKPPLKSLSLKDGDALDVVTMDNLIIEIMKTKK